MAEQIALTPEQLPGIAPKITGLPIGQARRLAKKRCGATLDVRLVESEEPQLNIVRQFPEEGDELAENRVIKVEVATRPWIQFLPGVYQDTDEENADFLQRFLLINQHLTSSIEERLEFLHEFFDSRLTPEKYLPWLASWLAMPLLEGWNEEKRREIIQRVPELYRLRGTAAGLKLALRLFADVKAEIHEGDWPYPGMVIGKSSTVGVDTTLSPPVYVSQCFTVELPDKKNEISRERLRTIQALVETEKPAHAHYALVFEKTEETFEPVPFWQFSKTGRIGVDARIGGHQDIPAVEDAAIQAMRSKKPAATTEST
jgi:phage tail-like protein